MCWSNMDSSAPMSTAPLHPVYVPDEWTQAFVACLTYQVVTENSVLDWTTAGRRGGLLH